MNARHATAALWLCVPVAAAAQGVGNWRLDERAILADYSVVTAVAASDARAYGATPNGLIVYDRRFHHWDPPVSPLDGYPRYQVRAALADPSDESVWLATTTGVIHYSPYIEQFEDVSIPGGVLDLMFDRSDPLSGLYVRTISGWEYLPRGGIFPTPAGRLPSPGQAIRPIPPSQLVNQVPFLQAMTARYLTDRRLRSFHYTSAAAVPGADAYYVGTDGLGMLEVSVATANVEPLPFGLLSTSVGAVITVPGGVWAGTGPYAPRDGFTYVGGDLERFDYDEGPPATGFGFGAVRAMVARGREIWAATDNGVVRTDGQGDVRRFGTSDGLPDANTFAIAQGPAGVWVGTARGLAFLADTGDGRVSNASLSIPVTALAAANDSVWVGSAIGLGEAAAGGEVVVPPSVQAVPELRDPITAIASRADTVIVATTSRLVWGSRGGASWHVERPLDPLVGVLTSLISDSGGVWVGGERGFGFFAFATHAFRHYGVPRDVPGAVRGLALDDSYLWIATDSGLVRFQRSAVRP